MNFKSETSLPMGTESKTEQSSNSCVPKFFSTRTTEACLDWVIFPILLIIQFMVTMYCEMRQGVLKLDWRIVLVVVVAFSIIAGIYRRILRRRKSDFLLLLLLPEIFTNILLALVMFGSLEIAFQALAALTALLAGICVFIQARELLFSTTETVPGDYERLLDSEEDDIESIEARVH